MTARIDEGELIRRLLLVIDEGRRETTYKLALILAVIDWCVTETSDTVPTGALAERVLELYWAQVRPYHREGDQGFVLVQGRRPKILSEVSSFRTKTGFVVPLRIARREFTSEYERTVKAVEKVLVQEPIPRLQTTNGQQVPFLYDCTWQPKVGPRIGDGRQPHVTLRPGVLDGMNSLGPLVRPIVERVWTSDLVAWNNLDSEEAQVRDHLFGSSRRAFTVEVRNAIATVQGHRCFYCHRTVARATHVDHFIPWSKHPTDAIENLVISCKDCNLSKTDHLCSPSLVRRWLDHVSTHSTTLGEIAAAHNLESNRGRTERIARGIYGALRPGALTWTSRGVLDQVDPGSLRSLLRAF